MFRFRTRSQVGVKYEILIGLGPLPHEPPIRRILGLSDTAVHGPIKQKWGHGLRWRGH